MCVDQIYFRTAAYNVNERCLFIIMDWFSQRGIHIRVCVCVVCTVHNHRIELTQATILCTFVKYDTVYLCIEFR